MGRLNYYHQVCVTRLLDSQTEGFLAIGQQDFALYPSLHVFCPCQTSLPSSLARSPLYVWSEQHFAAWRMPVSPCFPRRQKPSFVSVLGSPTFTASSPSCSQAHHAASSPLPVMHSPLALLLVLLTLTRAWSPALPLCQRQGTCPSLQGWCSATSCDGVKQRGARPASRHITLPVLGRAATCTAPPSPTLPWCSKNTTRHRARRGIRAKPP